MRKAAVSTATDALVYLLDCTLATVEHMARLKSRSQSEFKRQQAIAQTALDWSISFNADLSNTRAAEVMKVGSVAKWAEKRDWKQA